LVIQETFFILFTFQSTSIVLKINVAVFFLSYINSYLQHTYSANSIIPVANSWGINTNNENKLDMI